MLPYSSKTIGSLFKSTAVSAVNSCFSLSVLVNVLLALLASELLKSTFALSKPCSVGIVYVTLPAVTGLCSTAG